MPEGDTIHYAANRIRPVLEGVAPETVRTPHPRFGADRWPDRLEGRTVTSVDAHGKHLFLRFEEELTLHSHLRMTGSWGIHPKGRRWKRNPRRAWLVLETPKIDVVQFDGPVLGLMTESRTRLDRRRNPPGPDGIRAGWGEGGFPRPPRGVDPTPGPG